MPLWAYTLDDTSPVFTYLPFGDGPSVSDGWRQWSGGFIENIGDHADGKSLHITSLKGASVSLQFHGSSIQLSGTANCSYTVILDGTEYPVAKPTSDSTPPALFFWEGLEVGTHTINATAFPEADEQFTFDSAVITDTNGVSASAGQLTLSSFNLQDAALQYSGNWIEKIDPRIPLVGEPMKYMETHEPLASVSANITNAVAVEIRGNRDSDHWTYAVSLDGSQTEFNGSTNWWIGNAVLFFQGGLDPAKTYTVSLINTADNAQFALGFENITTYHLTDISTSSSSVSELPSPSTVTATTGVVTTQIPASGSSETANHVNIGLIVGPIIAGLAVVILLLLLVLRRQRRSIVKQAVPPPTTKRDSGLWQKDAETDSTTSSRLDYSS